MFVRLVAATHPKTSAGFPRGRACPHFVRTGVVAEPSNHSPMKRSTLLGATFLLALATAGCTSRIAGHSRSFNAPHRAPTYALAVTVHGGLQPTPAQWAAIQAKFAQELSWRGAVLVTDISLADKIIRVDFRPDAIDPENSGHISVLGVRTNPYSGVAMNTRTGPYSPGFSFASSFASPRGWGAADYYSGDYFNYIGPWENGYTSGATTVVTTPTPTPPATRPPHRHRPGNPELCPPDALHPRPTAPSFAVREPAPFVNMSPATPTPVPSPGRGRWTGERSAWRSEPASLPERTYARSERGRWRSSRDTGSDSGRSSRSERSYRPTSSSSSHSDSNYSSSSSGSSSDSGSGSSSGGSFSSPSYSEPSPAATVAESSSNDSAR